MFYGVGFAALVGAVFFANVLPRPISFSETVDADESLPSVRLNDYKFHAETRGDFDKNFLRYISTSIRNMQIKFWFSFVRPVGSRLKNYFKTKVSRLSRRCRQPNLT